jgi:hypothetical protein
MHTIHQNKSLTETAKILSCTPAFINRIQRTIGVGGKIGKRGVVRAFSEKDISILKMVKVFRDAGISYKKIKIIIKQCNIKPAVILEAHEKMQIAHRIKQEIKTLIYNNIKQ